MIEFLEMPMSMRDDDRKDLEDVSPAPPRGDCSTEQSNRY
jgi:hypothetical protein